MHGIFIEALKEGEMRIYNEENKHLKVVRAKKGERVYLTDGKGNHSIGTITHLGKNFSSIEVEKVKRSKKEKELFLFLSIIDQSRAEMIVEKGTELGVSGFLFFPSQRSQKKALRVERLIRRAKEAVKQSKNPFLPQIKKLASFEEAIEASKEYESKYFLDLNGGNLIKSKRAICFVGPEGGWMEEEVRNFKNRGFKRIRIGENTLRSETAAIAFSSLFMLS